MSVYCASCHRLLLVGESATARDWKVLGSDGLRVETRYTCDSCEGKS